MKKFTMDELQTILNRHDMWLRGKEGGVRANLYRADLSGADLSGANFSKANLHGANLHGADLSGANLHRADIRWANLTDVRNMRIPIACPETGSFVGFKKVAVRGVGHCIIKLQIPAKAKRCSATSRKCRCEYAKVLSITELDGSRAGLSEIEHYAYGHTTLYKIGEIVRPDSFDEDRWNECSHGIHFFITRQEAVDY